MDAQALKATGNAHFAKGEDQKAIDAYTAALEKTDDAPLRVAILSNRAACHLRLEAFAACVADCDGALALDGSKAKAYYRRARARDGLGELADAFRDLKACVRLEPANREAVALARSVKERLSATLKQEGAHESPAVQLALKISKCVESGEADGDARKRKGLFVSGARCAVEDEAAARALWKYGACDAACASAKSKTEDGEVRRAAVRMLAAAARHAGALEPSMVWQVAGVLRREGEGRRRRADAADEAAAAEEAALDIDDDAVVEDDGDASDDDADLTPARLRAAADGAAVVVVARALTSGTRRVRELGLDLLVRWLAPELSKEAAKKKKGLAAMFEASKPGHAEARERRAAEAKEKEDLRRCRARRLGKVLELPDGPVRRGVLGGLWALLDAKHDGERRKAQAAVARVCRAVARRGDPAQSDVEFEWDSPDEAAPASLVAALVAAGGVSDDAWVSSFPAGLADPLAAEASAGDWSRDLARKRRGAGLVGACHLACGHFAALAVEGDCCPEGVVDVVRLLGAREPLGEALGAEALSACASTNEGRVLLQPLVASGTLERLMEDGASTAVRSAAACAVAKLGLAAKALKSGARETGRLLDSAVALLRDALKRREEVAEGVGDGDDGVAAVERAVEVVAAMASASSVKEELAHGSGRCGAALPSLTALASASKGGDPVAYGLSCVFANLTVTNDELRRRHFADKEMDITAEQYDELQRITKQKAEDDADTDTADLCGARCVKLAMADGVLALANLAATDPSPLTSEHLAATLVALAKDENLRGTLVQQGGFKAAVALSEDGGGRSDKCRIFAGHAAAKILVTTDPNRLTDAQRLAGIRPLLWLCKQLKVNDLVHFEALLGLTNLLSLGETARRRVAANKGIHALEYLQFSDNDEVQRAATEALTNMVPDRDMIAHLLKPDKIKLWLAFAQEDDEADGGKGDVQLARAAIGCLAMASEGDADVARAIADNRGKAALDHVLRSKEPSLVHRGAYCLANCLHDRKARLKLNDDDALMAALTQACDDLKQHTNAGLLDALKEAAECLARTDWHDQPSDDEGEEG
ncbi:hypothetical protein SO694_00118021 [Aureococcus anophagefferens]|uniref:Protein unc-45 homolog B n=2 Tax=Aureococcus anophagefferens TaxID=44056 RepID=A0ABR1FWE7_AURAN